MSWGVDKARQLGTESFAEASASSRFLYEHLGYRVLLKVSFDASKTDPSDEWRNLEHELGPVVVFAMWRPAAGGFEADKTVLLWNMGKYALS